MPQVTGTRGALDRQRLAIVPGNVTVIQVGVNPLPGDDVGPCWISLEYYAPPYSYSIGSMFMFASGVRFNSLPSTSYSKEVIAYWRGDFVYSWIVSY